MSAVRRMGYLAASAALVCTQVAAVAVPRHPYVSGQLLVDVAGDGQGFVPDSTTPLLNDLALAPGYSTSGDVALKNDSGSSATLSVRATHVVEDENGCNHAEVWSGDTTCAPSGGELGRWLEVSIARKQGGRYQPLWRGSIPALAAGVTLPGSAGAHAIWPLRLTVTLPYAAGNDTQTDRAYFDLQWKGQGAGGRCSFARVRAAVIHH